MMGIGTRDGSVGTTAGYGLDGRGLISSRARDFLLSIMSKPSLGPIQPPVQRVPLAVSQWHREWVPETGHSPPSTAEVKNGGVLPPFSLLSHGVVVVK
jgi:hypothetical protein